MTIYSAGVPDAEVTIDTIAQSVVGGFSITDPNFSTEEGISIGASRSAVIDT